MGFRNMSHSNFLSQILFESSFSFHRHKKQNTGTMVANYSIYSQLKETIAKKGYILIYPNFLCHDFRVILQHEHILIAGKKWVTALELNQSLPGHSWRLQFCVFDGFPEHEPLEFSITDFVRIFVFVPPPQETEHWDHCCQSLHSQSTKRNWWQKC